MGTRRQGARLLEQGRQYLNRIDGGLSQLEVAVEFGVSQAHVSRAVRAARLPAETQERIARNQITADQALAGFAAPNKRIVRVVPPAAAEATPLAFDVVLSDKEHADVLARCRELGVQPGAIGRKLFTNWLRQAAA